MKRYGWIALLIVFALAVVIQSHIFMSWDVGWHLLDTQRLVAGGTYTRDFFDINPPMIFYLLIPPVLINKWFGGSIVGVFRGYIFIISILSLLTSYTITRRLFSKDDSFIHGVLICAIAVVFTILPIYEFGQRDPFVLLLLTPYILSVALRAKGNHLSKSLSLWIGFLAGLGFSLNLEFLFLFFLLEIYLKLTRTARFFRTETVTLLTVVVLYLLSIVIFFPDYISHVLPLVFYLYADTFNLPWSTMLFSAVTLTWLSSFVFFIIEWKSTRYKTVAFTLFASATIFLALYLATRKLWYYHMVPTLGFSSLLLVFLLSENLHRLHQKILRKKSKWTAVAKVTALYVLLIWFPLVTITQLTAVSWKTYTNPNTAINQLIAHVKSKSVQTIYVFSTTVTPAGILIPYVPVDLGSRFAGFWMLPGIIEHERRALNPDQKIQLEKTKQFLNNAVVEDFIRYEPELVFVDVTPQKLYFPPGPFDYLRYFSKDTRFAQLWRSYHYETTIANFALFRKAS